MIKLKKIIREGFEDNLIGYHVTSKNNLKSILNAGLVPKIPKDYGESGDVKAIYFFPTIEEMKNALYNWLGERIDEWEEKTGKKYNEICLKVDLSGVNKNMIEIPLDWEILVRERIPPEKIIDVIEDI